MRYFISSWLQSQRRPTSFRTARRFHYQARTPTRAKGSRTYPPTACLWRPYPKVGQPPQVRISFRRSAAYPATPAMLLRVRLRSFFFAYLKDLLALPSNKVLQIEERLLVLQPAVLLVHRGDEPFSRQRRVRILFGIGCMHAPTRKWPNDAASLNLSNTARSHGPAPTSQRGPVGGLRACD